MKLAITGHTNIEKIYNLPLPLHGQIYDKTSWDKLYSQLYFGVLNFLEEKDLSFSELTFISGMARGVDEVWASIAKHNNIPLILSIPNSIAWHKSRPFSRGIRAQAIYYDWILNYDKLEVFEIRKDYNSPNCSENYPYANAARNQHMVDISDYVFSFKSYDSTGTDDCIKRAQQLNKYKGNLNNEYI